MLVVMAAVAAVTTVLLAGHDPKDHVVRAAATTSAASAPTSPVTGDWRTLPRIPERAAIDAGHIVVSDDAAYVATQTRTTRRSATVRVWRWDGARWSGPVGRRAFTIDPDAGFYLTGGASVCLARTAGRRPLVSCVEDGAWRQLGQVVFPPSDYVTISDAIPGGGVDGAPTIISTGVPHPVVAPGGAGYTGHSESRAWTFGSSGWHSLSPEEIPGGAQGTQRPHGERIGGRLCVGVNALPDPMSGTRPSVHVTCSQGAGWRPLGPPVVPDASGDVDVDGLAGDGHAIYLGVIRWNPTPRWTILRGDGNGPWRPTSALGPANGWRTQGSLHRLLDHTFALVFEQRPSARGLRARLSVRTLDGDSGTPLGRPLLGVTTVNKPVTYDLAALHGELLALHSAGRGGGQVVVSRLAPH
jgi:hypothetical protein